MEFVVLFKQTFFFFRFLFECGGEVLKFSFVFFLFEAVLFKNNFKDFIIHTHFRMVYFVRYELKISFIQSDK